MADRSVVDISRYYIYGTVYHRYLTAWTIIRPCMHIHTFHLKKVNNPSTYLAVKNKFHRYAQQTQRSM